MDKKISPIDNPESNCFGCTAGMCGHQTCRGDQYFWDLDHNSDSYDYYEYIPETIETIDKEILHCYMCDWEHHNPNEWQNYKKAPNGTLQKWCGGCGRITLLLKTINIPFNKK